MSTFFEFTPTINICPSLNSDGSYSLKVSGYELNEIMKGLRYMEKQRESSRKYKDSKRGTASKQGPRLLSLNIIPPTAPVSH